jgi:hypothetical protein
MSSENVDWEQHPPVPPQILELLSQDGFTMFIRGGKEHGKTNLAMLIVELCQELKLRKHFATNIKTESYYIKQIANKPDLDVWLQKTKGLKTYVMDELGKNLRKFGFASKKNQDIMDILQLIRHFDCGFIGMAPSGKFVDSSFLLANDVLDMEIKKITKTTAKVMDYFHNESYLWCDIPPTSIIHNGKDIAKFDMTKPEVLDTDPLCCRVAACAAKMNEADVSMGKIGKIFNLNSEQAKRELIKHLKHSPHISRVHVEVCNSIETESTT